ncbi:MAG: shikimate kinase [Ruminococcaceae bacterium]|nr:shikimate kinase [Oscillospiraceae bacterium]
MNLILIGMPGSGKSTVGNVLAKLIGYRFLDTDLIIQNMEGKVLQDIIDEDGLSDFMTAEEKALCATYCEDTVIATGGSAIYSKRGMNHLKKMGKVVYLRIGVSELEKRLFNLASRGVAGAKDKTLAQLFEERRPLYEEYADYIIDCDGGEITENALKIVDIAKTDIISSRS